MKKVFCNDLVINTKYYDTDGDSKIPLIYKGDRKDDNSGRMVMFEDPEGCYIASSNGFSEFKYNEIDYYFEED